MSDPTFDQARPAFVALRGELHDALDVVGELVDVIDRTGSYLKPEHQATVRGARALLVQHGRAA